MPYVSRSRPRNRARPSRFASARPPLPDRGWVIWRDRRPLLGPFRAVYVTQPSQKPRARRRLRLAPRPDRGRVVWRDRLPLLGPFRAVYVTQPSQKARARRVCFASTPAARPCRMSRSRPRKRRARRRASARPPPRSTAAAAGSSGETAGRFWDRSVPYMSRSRPRKRAARSARFASPALAFDRRHFGEDAAPARPGRGDPDGMLPVTIEA